jgi:hypothetical protein
MAAIARQNQPWRQALRGAEFFWIMRDLPLECMGRRAGGPSDPLALAIDISAL